MWKVAANCKKSIVSSLNTKLNPVMFRTATTWDINVLVAAIYKQIFIIK